MLSLITGAAGFLGSHLANVLVDAGEDVILVDNLSLGHVRNLEHSICSGRATFVYADVALGAPAIAALVRGTEKGRLSRIYDFASPASPETYGNDPWRTLRVNAVGTISLIELALAHEARFLFASASESYGGPPAGPRPEGSDASVERIGPRSCYDERRVFGEASIAAAVRARGLDGRLVHFCNCYGPGMEAIDGRFVHGLMRAILDGRAMALPGDGSQTRSMIFVDDAISLLRALMERPPAPCVTVDIANDDERSVEEIARTIAGIAGVEFRASYVPDTGEDPGRRAGPARASGLGPPVTPLREGLRLTYRWFGTERTAYA